jgi:hypothetical protein
MSMNAFHQSSKEAKIIIQRIVFLCAQTVTISELNYIEIMLLAK